MADLNRNENQQESSSDEDRVVEFLYNRMIDSISTDVASGMHRMIKTGVIPYSDLVNTKSRRDIYPSLYRTDQDMEQALEEYVTEVPPPNKRLRRKASMESNTSEYKSVEDLEPAETTEQAVTMVTRGQITTSHDIWGRIPPKEPKAAAKCPVCSRYVSTLRFAPHLDKCMGIGTTSRAAAQNHSILS